MKTGILFLMFAIATLALAQGGAADLAFVPKSNLAIVPHMNENRIAAWDISDALR